MKQENLQAAVKKKRVYSSYQGEFTPAVPNVLQRDFHADLPNKKWLTDITEFTIPAGKVYLSPMIDCFDGMPVSWRIGISPNAELTDGMLDDAVLHLKGGECPIVHTDRGCHYRWPSWIGGMSPLEYRQNLGLSA
jgi:transposase InsO family protein